MKTKNLKKLIKDNIVSSTPDVLSKIDLQSIEIKEEKEDIKNKRFSFGFKFSLASAFSLLIVGAITWLIISFSGGPGPDPIKVTEKDKYFSFLGASAINILATEENNTNINSYATFTNLSVNLLSNLSISDYYDEISLYLRSVETLVGKGDKVNYEILDSEISKYKYKLILKTSDLLSREITYTFYYSEYRKGKQEDDEYEIKGIVFFDGLEYDFEAEFEREEDETEFSLIAYDKRNRSNYVKIEEEIESDEKEYLYHVCIDGKETLREYEIENEDDEVNINIYIEDDGDKFELFISKNDSNNYLYIEYVIDNQDEKIKGYLKARANADGSYSFEDTSKL